MAAAAPCTKPADTERAATVRKLMLGTAASTAMAPNNAIQLPNVTLRSVDAGSEVTRPDRMDHAPRSHSPSQ